MKPIYLNIDDEIAKKLSDYCDEHHATLAVVVRIALIEFLNSHGAELSRDLAKRTYKRSLKGKAV